MIEYEEPLIDLRDEIEVLTLALVSAHTGDERLQLRTRLRATLRAYVDTVNIKIAMAGYSSRLTS
jgi:hypothetical protein